MIYIIRHGQTNQNKEGRLQGRSNVPLNDKGRLEAQYAHDYFHAHHITFDECYSSPLDRAVETAMIVTGFDATRIKKDDRLLEMDYGPYEGIKLDNPPKEIKVFFSDFIHNKAPQGMEQLDDVVKRLGDFLKDIDDDHKNILISTHAIAMKGALEYLTPASHGSYWNKYIGNCAIYYYDGQGVPKEISYQ